MKIKTCFLAITALSAFLPGFSQNGRLFTAELELSGSLINAIYQDRNGIVWIATEDGLNQYDSSKFITHKHNPDENSPLHNYVRTFMEDRKGNFYIGYFNGLQTHDYASGIFREIPLLFENGANSRAHVSGILQRKNGEILISSGSHGIFRVTEENGEKIAIRNEEEIIPSREINCMYEDSGENLWVATQDKGLFRLTGRSGLKNWSDTPGVPQKSINAICEDNRGNIYIGSSGNGLSVYNAQSDTFTYIPYNGDYHLPIRALLWNGGKLLIGTDGRGMKTYSPQAGRISDWNFNIATFDFSKSKVHSIMKDNAGNLWLGLFQKGVMLIPSRSDKFRYIGYKSVVNNVIGSNGISSLCMGYDGTIWVGTDGDGLYGITPQGERKARYSPDDKTNPAPPIIIDVFEDSNRNLWLGSYRDGLWRSNPKSGRFEKVGELLDGIGRPVENVYSIVEDSEKRLWVGTMGAGLFSIDLDENLITDHSYASIQRRPNAVKEVHNNWIECLLISSDNKLYIGTYDGLGCMDLETENFVSPLGVNKILGGSVIYDIHEDSEGRLWLATNVGLVCKNRGSNETMKYTEDDGLPSDVAYAIEDDSRGNLWISTNRGLSCMNMQGRTFINYYANDGLQGNEFSKKASLVDGDGRIYFAGINGISAFHPSEITGQDKELIVRITDFYVRDRPVKVGMKSGGKDVVDTSVMEAREFRLSHEDNMFTVELAVMDYSNPQRIIYKYSVNGGRWVTLGAGVNRISFNNLDPGEYNFRFRARDYNITSEVKEITVHISPAWYASWWAMAIYGLVGIAVIVMMGVYIRQRYRNRQERMAYQHTKQIDEAKLQFFINISHEMRTPMSLLLNPLRKLISTDRDAVRQKMYAIMNRNTERILSLVNQLMDVRKIDQGQMVLKFSRVDVALLLRDVVSMFDDQADAKKIELTCRSSAEEMWAWIDPKHFDKILVNIISNALKFTPEGGKIDVTLTADGDYYEIIVTDSGRGIDGDEMERIFERFYQSRNTGNVSVQGTGIGLHLSRSLVELHHGTIRAENNPDSGACFIVRLPLGKAHLKEDELDDSPAFVNPAGSAIVPATPIVTDEEEKTKTYRKYRILVVDDDQEIRNYICREFSDTCHTMECKNGNEALEKILQKAPDLVVSDVIMPEMDGITLCRKIRQNVNINHIPIILLTAKSKEEDYIRGLDIGADAYMQKPFNVEILKRTALNLIRNRELLKNKFEGNQQITENIEPIEVVSHDDRLIEKILKVINDNIANPELNTVMLADKIGVSRVHLYRKMKELTNQSPSDFIRNARLQQAARMLSTRHLNITDVATATGFSNPSYFSNSFKELFGVRPSTYMEQALEASKSENDG